MNNNSKECNKCKEIKDLKYFNKSKSHKDGYYGKCKKCRSEAASAWQRANKDQVANNSLLWKYGITLDTYRKMLLDQDNKCLCCQQSQNSEKVLSVDHCHQTGKVRGLLCKQCNAAIGLIKENIATSERITQYLKDHNGSAY